MISSVSSSVPLTSFTFVNKQLTLFTFPSFLNVVLHQSLSLLTCLHLFLELFSLLLLLLLLFFSLLLLLVHKHLLLCHPKILLRQHKNLKEIFKGRIFWGPLKATTPIILQSTTFTLFELSSCSTMKA